MRVRASRRCKIKGTKEILGDRLPVNEETEVERDERPARLEIESKVTRSSLRILK